MGVVRKVILETRCEFHLLVEGPSEEAIKKWARSEQPYELYDRGMLLDVDVDSPTYVETEGIQMRKVHGVLKLERGDRNNLVGPIRVNKAGKDEDHREDD